MLLTGFIPEVIVDPVVQLERFLRSNNFVGYGINADAILSTFYGLLDMFSSRAYVNRKWSGINLRAYVREKSYII